MNQQPKDHPGRGARGTVGCALCLTAALGLLQACSGDRGADVPESPNPEASRSANEVTGEVEQARRHFSGMGVNLSSFDYWSNDFPTIDQFKRASTWFTSCDENPKTSCTFTDDERKRGISGWDTHEQASLDLDENGWVRSLPTANDPDVRYRYVTTDMFQGDHGAHPSGVYTVLYEGTGTIEYTGIASLVSKSPGRDLVSVTNADDEWGGGGFILRIRATTPGDYLRNIRVIPPGGVCSGAKNVHVKSAADCAANGTGDYISLETLSQTQIWFPTFLAELSGMRTIRFMDWGRTNDSKLASWADRPKKTDAFWTGVHGVPVASMVNLANTLRSDAWINLPTQVDDDYARNFARFVKNNLSARAKLILEYSNEPWNGRFWENYSWQYERAVELWGDPSVASPVGTRHEWVQNWHAMRAAQLCDIVKAEFGAEASRVECIVNSQASGGSWVALNCSLSCPRAVGLLGKPCADSFDAVAIAPYFGSYISEHAYRDRIVKTWFTQADGGLSKLFEEIRAKNSAGQPVTPPLADISQTANKDAVGGSISQSSLWMQTYKTEIAEGPYRKPIYSYEGGQHLISGEPYTCGDKDPADCASVEAEFQAKWQSLFTRANKDARMGKAYTEMMDRWRVGDEGEPVQDRGREPEVERDAALSRLDRVLVGRLPALSDGPRPLVERRTALRFHGVVQPHRDPLSGRTESLLSGP